ncbi:MAG: hypothetical protein DWQ10_05855 [Calditrichaeota bacterium]|nr:MAG: hypothetical protein DWQ10_05855 [Calditrichota bacterium]
MIFLLTCATQVMAQGISRPSGFGVRLAFWNITNQKSSFSLSTDVTNVNSSVSMNGFGSYIYYFSRFQSNIFFETHLGAFAAGSWSLTDSEHDNVSMVIPLLFGLRWDLLPGKLPTSFQPYLTIGGGPYWNTEISGSSQNIVQNEVLVETGTRLGWYAGGGMNLMLASWFALNFDLKHHFINYEQNDDFSGLETSLGFVFMWGAKKEMFRIQDVRVVVEDIYPAYYQFYNSYPIALVSIRNTAGYDIEVNVRSVIKGYSLRAKNSGYFKIRKGQTRDIPVHSLFGTNLLQMERRRSAVLDVEVEGKAGHKITKSASAQLTVHSRNAWDGAIDKLGVFLTPEDQEIREFTKSIRVDDTEEMQQLPDNLKFARAIFSELVQHKLRYHPDPNIPFYMDDRVQYAGETLQRGSGDCDDLVVLYATLLESVGIRTAFVEVQDPEKPIAHVYLMFDTGLTPIEGYRISPNDKRYVIRLRDDNRSTVWIPVETTLVDRGFEDAWRTGATAYLEEGKIRNGLADGWVRIIDHE